MSFPRYPTYKASGVNWLGEVPDHWGVMPLKKIVAVPITDGPHETPQFIDDGVPFVSAEAVSSGRIDFAKVRAWISSEDNARYSMKYSPKLHDIYMVKSGATTGVTAIVEDRTDFNIWSPLAVIRCGGNALPRFILNFMRSRNFLEAIALNWSFGTQQNIGMGVIENLSCTLPPLEEQTQIAAFLNRETAKIDGLVAEQRRLLELLKEKRQAVISHTVTQGLNPNARMKPSGIEWLGNVPEHWRVMPLGYLCSKIGSGKTPLGGAEAYVDEGILFIRSQNVYDEGLFLDDVVYITAATDAEMPWSRVLPGDILLNITGASLGRTCLVPHNCGPTNVNQHVCILRLFDAAMRDYVAMVLKSSWMKSQFVSVQTGAARDGLNFSQISRLVLAVPPAAEQSAIADFLQRQTVELDALTAEAERAIGLLQERRTALISAAVTGQIDVRGLAEVEAA